MQWQYSPKVSHMACQYTTGPCSSFNHGVNATGGQGSITLLWPHAPHLQDALGGEVKRCAGALSGINPVAQALLHIWRQGQQRRQQRGTSALVQLPYTWNRSAFPDNAQATCLL